MLSRFLQSWLPVPVVLPVALAVLPLLLAGCSKTSLDQQLIDTEFEPFEKLSDYELFYGDGSSQEPAPDVVPYDLNSALFSDYATKYRFVRLPLGTRANYQPQEVFDFPVGTIIVKTFAYLNDLRDPSLGQQLIETRLLIHRADGWIGVPYVWNEEQTEAYLDVAGSTVDVSWTHTDGVERSTNYIIPNSNQCKSCHDNEKKMMPIGPKARNLNKDFAYYEGTENQLVHWTKAGILAGAPDPADAPRLANDADPASGTLDERARAWLEINCAHCHNPKGPAKTSGLDLMASQKVQAKIGVWKTPVAAGLGSGGLAFDIVPGKPDESILLYRIVSTDPGVMMPELPRRLVDVEGITLIAEWIRDLPDPGRDSQ